MCMRGRFNITLSESINDVLDQYANKHDMTRSAVIETALKEFLQCVDITQNVQKDNQRSEVDELTQRMTVMEDQLAQLIQTLNNTRPYQYPDEPISIQNIVEDQIINSEPILNPEGWYRQIEIAKMMPESINFGTRKKKVSIAVSKGDLISNGKKGSECLINISSANEWLKTIRIIKMISNKNPDSLCY